MATEGLSSEKEDVVLRLLARVWGTLSPELLRALARLLRLPAVELLVIRQRQKVREVFLVQNPSDALRFASRWHVAGEIAQLSDNLVKDTLWRIARGIGCPDLAEDAELLGVVYSKHIYGGEMHCVFYVVVDTTAEEEALRRTEGKWFRVDQLPKPFMEHQRPFFDLLQYV